MDPPATIVAGLRSCQRLRLGAIATSESVQKMQRHLVQVVHSLDAVQAWCVGVNWSASHLCHAWGHTRAVYVATAAGGRARGGGAAADFSGSISVELPLSTQVRVGHCVLPAFSSIGWYLTPSYA